MKFSDTLTESIKTDLQLNIVSALMGESGIGKSSFVEALGASINTKVFVLPCNQMAAKEDLTGARLVPTADGKSFTQVFYPHHMVVEANEYALAHPREFPILFLDEINRTPSDVTSGLLTMVTLRRLGQTHLAKNLRLMVAGNNKGNVTALDEASLSRFALYAVEADAPTLIKVLGASINPWVKQVLVSHPDYVFERSAPNSFLIENSGNDDDADDRATMASLTDAGDEMLQLTTPRTIEAVSDWLNAMDNQKIQEYLATPTTINFGDGQTRDTTVLNELIEGKLGNTKFTKQLIANITVGISTGATQTTVLTAAKPSVYDDLKNAGTADELNDLISSLDNREKSGCLVFALFEKVDNTRLLGQLATVTTGLEPDNARNLMQLSAAGELDEGNVTAFLETGSSISESLRMVLDIF